MKVHTFQLTITWDLRSWFVAIKKADAKLSKLRQQYRPARPDVDQTSPDPGK